MCVKLRYGNIGEKMSDSARNRRPGRRVANQLSPGKIQPLKGCLLFFMVSVAFYAGPVRGFARKSGQKALSISPYSVPSNEKYTRHPH